MIKIGNGAGFWGDDIDAGGELLRLVPDLDFLTLDYLAEVSLSIMAAQRAKDSSLGYAKDFLHVVKTLLPLWKEGLHCKVVTNAGGLNPRALATLCQRMLEAEKLPLKVAFIEGDDVAEALLRDPENPLFKNLDSGASLSSVSQCLVTANAYLGARPIADALSMGAHLVITGRVADPSLTVAPCLYHFGWLDTAYDEIAGATVAGHLIECGAQVTGGIATDWLDYCFDGGVGFPIAEVNEDGTFVITKPSQSGGAVNERTVKEQLLYEIGDPDCYLSPDITASFLSLKVREIAPNRVEVKGAKGRPPPLSFKVSATYRAGFKVEAYLALFGDDLVEKSKKAADILFKKVKRAGYSLEEVFVEVVGAGAIVPGISSRSTPLEAMMRFSLRANEKEPLEYFAKQIAPLVTAGPQGTTGYINARAEALPLFGFWPCLIDRKEVVPHVRLVN